MTSQVEDQAGIELQELRQRAKDLKVKGCGILQADKLIEKIAEAEGKMIVPAAEDAPRKKAPKMKAFNIKQDDRAKKVAELEAADPGAKYIFQPAKITDDELEAKGFERTSVSTRNDILVRTDKESYEQVQKDRNAYRLKNMKRIDKAEVFFKGHKANPKTAPGSSTN